MIPESILYLKVYFSDFSLESSAVHVYSICVPFLHVHVCQPSSPILWFKSLFIHPDYSFVFQGCVASRSLRLTVLAFTRDMQSTFPLTQRYNIQHSALV